LAVQGIAVVGLIPDQSRWKFVQETVPQGLFDQLAFVRRSSLDTDGERNTVASGDSRDLRPFASLGRPDPKPPFFAAAKVASMKASSKFNRPSACNRLASFRKTFSNAPERTHCWNRRWQV
jgi:hypothetical protein